MEANTSKVSENATAEKERNEAAKAGNVAGSSSAAPLSPQMALQALIKNASRDAKLHSLGLELMRGEPASADKTDNSDPRAPRPFDDAPDMRREDERLKTFAKWPVAFLRPDTLASNGFYYLGRGDEVRCAFCKVEIMRWQEGDDPAADHQRWAPQCPFLRRRAAAAPDGAAPAQPGRDECGARAPARTPGPVHPQYASQPARMRSFRDWPRSMRQKPEELAEAGFFYTGQGDKTKCFYCDGGLKDWEDDDVPWEQHARWFDRCAFVQLVKGRDYVQQVKSEAAVVRAPAEAKEPAPAPAPAAPAPAPAAPAADQPPEPPLDDSKLCKICFAEERNVCFVPCGHVVACARCALSTDKCPMCRRTFQSAVRLYYS